MRERMIKIVNELFTKDERLALVLADISAASFKPLMARYPHRALNVGIMEQSMIGVAAGMALEGFIPVTHTIAPFLAERAFEQLKIDFDYQGLGGNFITIGASYDYATEGATHQAPGDVMILKSLPSMQIVLPGTADEFETLFRESYANGAPTYFRLTNDVNPLSQPVNFGKMTVLRSGSQATILAVGPALRRVLPAVEDLDVTVLYATTVAPFDSRTLRQTFTGGKLILVEPYYTGALAADIMSALQGEAVRLTTIGQPHQMLHTYGTPEHFDELTDFTPAGVRRQIERALQQ
jgi:transketolase